jgi:hypothetical protein
MIEYYEHLNLKNWDDLTNYTIVDIENERLILKDMRDGKTYLLNNYIMDCCNYGGYIIKNLNKNILPALITKVEGTDPDIDDNEFFNFTLTLFHENKKIADIDCKGHETGYYGSMTDFELIVKQNKSKGE